MQAVILAGGLGTRLSEETHVKPKPMVEIGGRPIIWHIMKIYSSFGINDFIVCCGYKGYAIKEYFANYFMHNSDVTFSMGKENKITYHARYSEPWNVTLVDTGDNSQTGGRLMKAARYITDEAFCMTYGDGVADVNIKDLVASHRLSKKLVTLTAVQPPGRFGTLTISDSQVTSFVEKPLGDDSWINGGFFVVQKEVLSRIEDELCNWEQDFLPVIASENQLMAYKHCGFWQPMDTLRDKTRLQDMWQSGHAPWKIW